MPEQDQPRPIKILIVDDDRALCRMMSRALSAAGFQTFPAFGGEEGLEIFKAERPELVLTDFAMPGMNGFELVNEIRRIDGNTRRTIVVIVTAYSQTFLVSVDFQVDVDSYLTKPLVPSDVASHVKNLLAQKG